MHDGAPAHRTKFVKKWLSKENISTLEWPGNSPDLNPIENAWNVMKNKVQEAQPVNISELTHVLKTMWVTMEIDYFEKLADSMPRSLQDAIQAKGFMTKYLITKLLLLKSCAVYTVNAETISYCQ